MTPEDMEHALTALVNWTDEAADILNRLAERIQAMEVKVADLHARVDEWDVRP